MHTNILSVLQAIGFSEKQATIYLTGLELGTASSGDIADKSGENKVTVYKVLHDMETLGYTKLSLKGSSKFFTMIAPNEILDQQRIRTKKLERVMPDILGMMKGLTDRPKIKIYDGIEPLKKLYLSVLKTTEDFRMFIGGKIIDQDFYQFVKSEIIPKRALLKNKSKAILSNTDPVRIKHYQDNHECIVISDDFFKDINELLIYDYTKVAIISYETGILSAFVIESKTFHDAMAAIFHISFMQGKLLEDK